jgi:hypothetical protein
LWLNFANGGTDWNQLVDTNGNGVPDAALSTLLTNAENIRLAAGSTRAQLLAMAPILERINRPRRITTAAFDARASPPVAFGG